jgi:Tfp pilus assembly protein PilV
VKSIPSRQLGATLLVSLIMLVLITMLAVTSFRIGKSNLQIAGNMQQRNQALSAAQSAVEQVISRPQFADTPANAVPNPCNGVANTTCVDVNGDGVTDVNVAVTLSCVRTQIIPNSRLNLAIAEDEGCYVGVRPGGFGQEGTSNDDSICTDMVWDAQAVATDSLSNAQFTINQGLAVRKDKDAICP